MSRFASLVLRSHAKLNLCLEVLGRRGDGYHDLATIFTAISIWDTVRLEVEGHRPRGAPLEVHTEGWPVPGGSSNLCTRAAGALLEALLRAGDRHVPARVHIGLVKRLPPGGGLGGGSGNAAAVLVGLNALLGEPLDRHDLLSLAASVGSDVPFFVSGAPAALGTGRGERLEELPALRPLALVVAWPGLPVPTRWAYGKLSGDDFSDGSATADLARAVEAKHELLSLPAFGCNAFFGPVTRERPDIAALAADLRRAGATVISLAGSGACVWGALEDARRALDTERKLRRQGLWACVAWPVERPVEVVDQAGA